mmetsp:Transcript_38041/g.122064  ORF Transcript_38041/g.122064 Transcript_38041/m.122064 type:complete len:235 (+) Transcript_38041:145-849(+)
MNEACSPLGVLARLELVLRQLQPEGGAVAVSPPVDVAPLVRREGVERAARDGHHLDGGEAVHALRQQLLGLIPVPEAAALPGAPRVERAVGGEGKRVRRAGDHHRNVEPREGTHQLRGVLVRLVAVAELAARPVAPGVDAAAAAEGEGALVSGGDRGDGGASEGVDDVRQRLRARRGVPAVAELAERAPSPREDGSVGGERERGLVPRRHGAHVPPRQRLDAARRREVLLAAVS